MAPVQSVLVIPARGGSQRIPGKNIRSLAGIPVLERTINIARASGTADQIYVTTDSPEIAELARHLEVQVIDRPADLADHHTPLLPVMQHAVAQLSESWVVPESIAVGCLYATAVTLDPTDLASGLECLWTLPKSARGSFVIGVCAYSHPTQRALKMSEDSHLTPISPEFAGTRTQDLPQRFFDAGAFIWGFHKAWVQTEPILGRSVGHRLPTWRSVDLDTEDDWKRAELVINQLERSHE